MGQHWTFMADKMELATVKEQRPYPDKSFNHGNLFLSVSTHVKSPVI